MARWSTAAALLIGAAVAALVTGCKADSKRYCQEKCACEGCGSGDEQRCVVETNGEQRTMRDLACGGVFDEYLACITDHGVCISGQRGPLFTDDEGACAAELTRLDQCR